MEVERDHGLHTGRIGVAEAVGTDWAAWRGAADLVRVVDPAPESWPALLRAGFVVKPAWITWLAPVGESEAAFLDRLSVNERRNVRLGLRFVADRCIELRTAAPLDAESFDAFLGLYDRQIAAMAHGVPFARRQRADLLARGEDYVLVQAFDGNVLIGCCVCWKRPDVATLQIRFVTTAPDGRQNRVVRAMYLRVFQIARDLGYRDVSLGTDPALYGHIAKPGLFGFKSRLGFSPVPARMFASDDDPDEAVRVLRLGTLTDPSLVVSYHLSEDHVEPVDEKTPLRLEVFTGDPEVDTTPFRAAFLSGIGVRHLVRQTGE
ncbi:GNAT family N-acetyltransferase [Actinokineospora iranica]|uniref:N-acetyltransferase domain-containing protein n=1 Tax=Actinokineospora iranica TaxID=1271860 RepID=A0A1G6JV75_9PSEU|nr:GNAT family N-acetyltransferase [Actinokineospora iranica]SDC22650.1 hypothetical protein SAMN05216174_101577 [Actinokineospora iranica]